MNRGFYLLAALLLSAAPVSAAPVPSEDAKALVRMYFNNVEKGMGDSGPIFAAPAKDMIPALGEYLLRGTDNQQSRAVGLISLVGRRSKDRKVRTLAVKALLDYATTEGKPATRLALANLLHFSRDDFPPKADAVLEKLVRESDPHSEAFLLAAIVGVRSVIKDLKALAVPPGPGNSLFINPGWSAHLALARLGEADSLKHCIATIAAEKDCAQKVRHFEDLVFTRQDAAAKALAQYLFSEERLPGLRRGDEGTRLALYALETMAQSVEGFPIKSEGGPSHTDTQLSAARKWVKQQKELKFKP
jgi:hypothetical protein